MNKYTTDFEVRKATLRKLGGDPTGLQTTYEVDLAILDKIGGGGGGGLTPEEVAEIVKEVAYAKIEGIDIKTDPGYPTIEVYQTIGEENLHSWMESNTIGCASEKGDDEGCDVGIEVMAGAANIFLDSNTPDENHFITLSAGPTGAYIQIDGSRVLTEEDLDGVNEILESVLY